MQAVLRWLLAVFFLLAGGNHFLNKKWYLAIMPAYLPLHLPLVYLSGVAEMTLGAALLVPGLRQQAGWGLTALLLAIFPANVNMALHPERFRGFPPALLWGRLPLQFALIALVLWASRNE